MLIHPTTITSVLECTGVVQEADNTCIRLLGTTGAPMPFSEAETACADAGGKLADIRNSETMDKVSTYILNTWEGYTDETRGYVNVWLASTYTVSAQLFLKLM